jgi:hypothetical protein
MQGEYEGTQAFFKDINKQTEYVPGAEHSLNLGGEKAASTIPEAVDYCSPNAPRPYRQALCTPLNVMSSLIHL